MELGKRRKGADFSSHPRGPAQDPAGLGRDRGSVQGHRGQVLEEGETCPCSPWEAAAVPEALQTSIPLSPRCVQAPPLWQSAFLSCSTSVPQELLTVVLECLQLPGPMLRLGIPLSPWNSFLQARQRLYCLSGVASPDRRRP